MVVYFPRMVVEEDNENLYKRVSREELRVVLNTFQKDKSLGPDVWTAKFYLDFFQLIREDLLRVVEEVRLLGKVPGSINSTFIALIPNLDYLDNVDGSWPISLHHCVYKIISKIIAIRFKLILSKFISSNQFGFLEGGKIHEAIGFSHEGLHIIKISQYPASVINLDLSKAYDRIS